MPKLFKSTLIKTYYFFFVRRKSQIFKSLEYYVTKIKIYWKFLYSTFKEKTLDGLNMLLIACEELGAPREDISSNRAKELKKLMLRQVDNRYDNWQYHWRFNAEFLIKYDFL